MPQARAATQLQAAVQSGASRGDGGGGDRLPAQQLTAYSAAPQGPLAMQPRRAGPPPGARAVDAAPLTVASIPAVPVASYAAPPAQVFTGSNSYVPAPAQPYAGSGSYVPAPPLAYANGGSYVPAPGSYVPAPAQGLPASGSYVPVPAQPSAGSRSYVPAPAPVTSSFVPGAPRFYSYAPPSVGQTQQFYSSAVSGETSAVPVQFFEGLSRPDVSPLLAAQSGSSYVSPPMYAGGAGSTGSYVSAPLTRYAGDGSGNVQKVQEAAQTIGVSPAFAAAMAAVKPAEGVRDTGGTAAHYLIPHVNGAAQQAYAVPSGEYVQNAAVSARRWNGHRISHLPAE